MLHVGLDLSRKRIDVCRICDRGGLIDHFPAPADRDGRYGLTRHLAVYDRPVRGVVESMNGARFVRDELVAHGWEGLDRRRAQDQGAGGCGARPTRSTRACWQSCRGAIWCGDLAADS